MSSWEQLVGIANQIPTGVWVALAVANVVVTAATWSVARRRMRRAGQRATHDQPMGGAARAKDTTLTVAAMIPAGLFWTMVMAGSFHGLVAFGRDMLGWRDGWEYLVPGTLDGVSVTFAFLAFRAVRMAKPPDRCRRVVWSAALASAAINFAYEYTDSGHNLVAGGYLALLSLLGMIMFHEFLDQFEEGTGEVRRKNPAFGLRWITWPTNTFCAAVAWQNYPPADDTPATRRNALANLDRVRALKSQAREAATAERHRQAIATARRESELAASLPGPREPTRSTAVAAAASNARPNQPEPRSFAAVLPPAATPHPAAAGPPRQPAPMAPVPRRPTTAPTRATAADVRVPATAATLTQWAQTWVRMCGDGDTALGPLNDDARARAQYALSAKQLRNIRNAATSGALRRRAAELGVELPDDYQDQPVRDGINGHPADAAAA